MRYLPNEDIEIKASNLLDELKAMAAPVRVDAVAHRMGLLVEEIPLGDEVSGVLVIENGQGTIGVNKNHAPARKRFSIAHEIGHYVLHRKESELFIDKKFAAVFRDNKSSTGEHRIEIQANLFAASLLMPRYLLEKEIKVLGLDLGDDLILESLAGKFEVSVQAMTYRLSNLATSLMPSF